MNYFIQEYISPTGARVILLLVWKVHHATSRYVHDILTSLFLLIFTIIFIDLNSFHLDYLFLTCNMLKILEEGLMDIISCTVSYNVIKILILLYDKDWFSIHFRTDLAIECFDKSRKNQPLLPLQSLKGFSILHCGTQGNTVPRQTRSVSPAKGDYERTRPFQTAHARNYSPPRSLPRMSLTTTQVNRCAVHM